MEEKKELFVFVLEDSFFSKACEIILYSFISGILSFFFLTGRQKNEEEEEEEEGGSFCIFFDATRLFFCVIYVEGFLSFLVLQEQQSQKQKTKKKNEKKRGVFLGPLFAQKKPNNNTTRVVFQFRAAVGTTRI